VVISDRKGANGCQNNNGWTKTKRKISQKQKDQTKTKARQKDNGWKPKANA